MDAARGLSAAMLRRFGGDTDFGKGGAGGGMDEWTGVTAATALLEAETDDDVDCDGVEV